MNLTQEHNSELHTFQVNVGPLQEKFLNLLKKEGKSVNTLKNYKTDLDCFSHYLMDFQKNQRLNQIDLPQVVLYGKYLETKYSSDNSRRRRVQTLRRFFDYLVSSGVIPSNPVRKIPTSPKFVDIPRPAQFMDIKKTWIQLIEEAQNDQKLNKLVAQRNQVLFLLIYEAGLKVSDLAKLRRHSIKLGKCPRVIVAPKSRDPYSIELPHYCSDLITDYLSQLDQFLSQSTLEFPELLFNANPYKILSGGISPRGIEIIFEEYRKKLKVDITPKSLRQSCVFKWLHRKLNDATVKEWMGVAPSYVLKPYRDELNNHFFAQNALPELYYNFLKRN